MTISKHQFFLCMAALCALLTGCAGSTPTQNHEYLLRPPPLEVTVDSSASVRLKPVSVAPYLDQSGIVLQMGESEVRVARQHTWAEPLDEAIGRYLQVGIASRAGVNVEVVPLTTGTASTSVTVRISQLHGSADGQVRLVAGWVVAGAEGERTILSMDEKVQQTTDGYPALVAAHALLLERLAEAIAASLN